MKQHTLICVQLWKFMTCLQQKSKNNTKFSLDDSHNTFFPLGLMQYAFCFIELILRPKEFNSFFKKKESVQGLYSVVK